MTRIRHENAGWCSPASLSMIHAYPRHRPFRRANGAGGLRPRVQRHGQLGVQRGLQRPARFARLRRASCQSRPRSAPDRTQSAACDLLLVARRRAAGRAARSLRRTSRRALRLHARGRLRDQRSRRAERARRLSAGALEYVWQRNEGVAYVVAPIGIEYADVLASAVKSLSRRSNARSCAAAAAPSCARTPRRSRGTRSARIATATTGVSRFRDSATRAPVVLVGLAPGAHGSNRTGRPFTGDASGGFLYPALYRAGFASQPHAIVARRRPGLRDCFITAALRCAPPHNMPTPGQLRNCFPYLLEEFDALAHMRVAIGLGPSPSRRCCASCASGDSRSIRALALRPRRGAYRRGRRSGP